MAAADCARPGLDPSGRVQDRRADYQDLVVELPRHTRVHQRWGWVVLLGIDFTVRKAVGLREWSAARDWLTSRYLPPSARCSGR
ncbi:hypothetical protein LMJ41_13715 [Streptomyces globisporus]|nr:hypothetical protein [Streptomyces globisporus]